MFWPSMIPQPTTAPAVYQAAFDPHAAAQVVTFLILLAAISLGLGLVSLATREDR